MAGRGSRFANVGFKLPKPLIKVFEKPMIQWVVDNLDELKGNFSLRFFFFPKKDSIIFFLFFYFFIFKFYFFFQNNLGPRTTFVFCVLKEHLENKEWNLAQELEKMSPGCKIVSVDGVTEGTACTVLLAKQYFNDENTELLVANSDQFLEWSSGAFYDEFQSPEV